MCHRLLCLNAEPAPCRRDTAATEGVSRAIEFVGESLMRCACPPDGSFYCPRCTALLARVEGGGTTLTASPLRPTVATMALAVEPRGLRQGKSDAPLGHPGGLQRDMPEEHFLALVRALAKQHGWLLYHTHRSDRSEPGFPDLVCTDGARLIFIELKSVTGKLTQRQAIWLDLLRHTGQCEVYEWRPADWPKIVETLSVKVET